MHNLIRKHISDVVRPSVLGRNRSHSKNSILVLQVWCCVVKHGLVTLVVIMILKDTASFQVPYAWNVTRPTAHGHQHGVLLLKKLNPQVPLFTSGGLGLVTLDLDLVLRIWSFTSLKHTIMRYGHAVPFRFRGWQPLYRHTALTPHCGFLA